jgi:hypothetical protein
MAAAMHAGCHCPLCDGDFPDFVAFNDESHMCIRRIQDDPEILERVIKERVTRTHRERRTAARYLALFQSMEEIRR